MSSQSIESLGKVKDSQFIMKNRLLDNLSGRNGHIYNSQEGGRSTINNEDLKKKPFNGNTSSMIKPGNERLKT